MFAERYRLEGELGSGGYGVVYRAHDNNTGRDVALKVFKQIIPSSVAFREAHILTALEGPHVLRMFDADVWNDIAHVSSGIAANRTVQDHLGVRGVAEQQARLWVAHLLSGLEAMHRLGLVHRDIKPANVFLDSPEHARLGDFGTAAVLASGQADAEGDLRVRAPEMFSTGHGGPRSDIYSVGVTLWCCLTGRWPFDATAKMTQEEYGKWVLAGLPNRLRNVAPHVSGLIARITEKALAVDPDDRFQSAEAMAIALGRLPVPKRWWREETPHAGHLRCWIGHTTRGTSSDVTVCVSVDSQSRRHEITTRKQPSDSRILEHCNSVTPGRVAAALRKVFDTA